jgi:hypothetical protein
MTLADYKNLFKSDNRFCSVEVNTTHIKDYKGGSAKVMQLAKELSVKLAKAELLSLSLGITCTT